MIEYLGLWLLHVMSGMGLEVQANVFGFGFDFDNWKGVRNSIDLGGN